MKWLFLILLLCLSGCSRGPGYLQLGVTDLERQLESSDPTLKTQAVIGLGRQGAKAKPATPALIQGLALPDPLLRQQICITLARIGPDNDLAIPALLVLLDDPEWTVRRQAILALGAIEAPLDRVEQPLQQCAAEDANNLVRKSAQETLVSIKNRIPKG